jgi:hypothetical protein
VCEGCRGALALRGPDQTRWFRRFAVVATVTFEEETSKTMPLASRLLSSYRGARCRNSGLCCPPWDGAHGEKKQARQCR